MKPTLRLRGEGGGGPGSQIKILKEHLQNKASDLAGGWTGRVGTPRSARFPSIFFFNPRDSRFGASQKKKTKKKPGTPLPSCAAAAAAGRARLGPGRPPHTPCARTRCRSTSRNERPPERRDEAAATGGFYSSFPSRKRKQTGTRRPPLPASELTPSRASQLPAQLPPAARPPRARLAALSDDRAPAHTGTH